MKNIFLITLILLTGACIGERFEPFSLVNSVRVLAVQSSLPELRPGEETELSALTFVPDGAEATYAWEWCPFGTTAGEQYKCPFTQDELVALISESLPEGSPMINIPLEDFDLGNGKTASLKYPAPQAFLEAICKGIQEAAVGAAEDLAENIPTLSCEDGYEISIRLAVTQNGKTEVASKRVNLWLGGEQEKDENPVIGNIQIRPKEKDKQTLLDAGHDWVSQINDFENDWYTLPVDEATPVLVGLSYDMKAGIDEESIQVYAKRAPDGANTEFLEAEREAIEFQWLTTFGSLSPGNSIYFASSGDLEDAQTTRLFFPDSDLSQESEVSNGETFINDCPELVNADTNDGCEIEVWSVARDDRLGVGWMKRNLIATGIASEVTP